MPSKTSYFNKNLFFHTLSRFWPLWAGYLLVWLFCTLGVANNLGYYMATSTISYITHTLPRQAYNCAIICSFVFAAPAAMAAFSHLYSIRSVGLVGSLPLYRESVFLSQSLAGLASFFVSNVIVFLITMAVEGYYGILGIGFPYLLQSLALACLMNITFYGLAMLCAQLTGHLIVVPAVYFMLSFAAVVIESIVHGIIQSLLFGLTGRGGMTLTFLSPVVQLFDETGFYTTSTGLPGDNGTTFFNGWLWVLVYAAVGVLLYLLALWLYRRRRMETAGDFIACTPLRPVFKYVFATGCALVFTFLLSSILNLDSSGTSLLVGLCVMLPIGAFIGYFAAEMLIRRSFRVFRKSWRGFAVLGAVLITLTCLIDFDVLGIEKKQPTDGSYNQIIISTNSATASRGNTTLTSPQGLAEAKRLHQLILSSKGEHEQAERRYDPTNYVNIVYLNELGEDILYRSYWISHTSEAQALLNEVVNSPEAIASRQIDVPVTLETITYASINYYSADSPERGYYTNLNLSAADALELYTQCILPDIEDGTLGRIWFYTDESRFDTLLLADFSFELAERMANGDYRNHYFGITLTRDAVRTLAWCEARGLSFVGERETVAWQNEKYPHPADVVYQISATSTDLVIVD